MVSHVTSVILDNSSSENIELSFSLHHFRYAEQTVLEIQQVYEIFVQKSVNNPHTYNTRINYLSEQKPIPFSTSNSVEYLTVFSSMLSVSEYTCLVFSLTVPVPWNPVF